MRHKISLVEPEAWGPDLKEMVISKNGHYIAIKAKVPDSNHRNYWRVLVYDTRGSLIASTRNPNGGEWGIAFWPDDTHLLLPGHNPTGMASGKGPSALKLCSLGGDSFSYPFINTPLHGSFSLYGTSASGRYVVGALGCYDTYTQQLEKIPFGKFVTFSPNENFLAVNTANNLIQLGESPSHQLIEIVSQKIIWEKSWTSFLTFSADSSSFLTSSVSVHDGKIQVVSLELLELQRVIDAPIDQYDYFCSAAYSLDGNLLAAGSKNGHAYLWETKNHTLLDMKKHAHSYPITQIRFSSRQEVITLDHYSVSVWEAQTTEIYLGVE